MAQQEMAEVIEKEEKTKDKPHHLGHRQRLRQRLLQSPKGTLPDYEILEILLFAASPRADMKPLAKSLLSHYGSLAKLFQAPTEELLEFKGVSEAAIAQFRVVQESVERVLRQEVLDSPILQSWHALLDYCRASMGSLETEQFRIIFLNNKNRVIADELQGSGTVDHTPVYPREVVKRALTLNASAIILVHNHPSGNTTPSKADIQITHQIVQALDTVNIKVHDHVIIGAKSHYSFKSHGVI